MESAQLSKEDIDRKIAEAEAKRKEQETKKVVPAPGLLELMKKY